MKKKVKIMFIVYNILLIGLVLIFIPFILIAFILQPKFRSGFFQKIGFYSYNNKKQSKTVVFHAVSVGETNAIIEIVKKYHKMHPDENIVITTTTKTGQTVAKKIFENIASSIVYFPYDFFFSVNSFFNTFNPQKIIIAETEIWPCFVISAKKKGIKLYTINGRISPHSYEGYKKIKMFLNPILNSYEKIFMQSHTDEQRMIDIGADRAKVEVMGNLKFDIEQNLTDTEIKQYASELQTENYRVFIAASTHKGEDEIVIQTYKKLKEKHPDAKLLLAPRHPQRFDEAANLLQKEGLNFGKRSSNDNFDKVDAILLDTMGELSKLYSLCYLAFIGGSFSPTGGHNPLEASIWEKPVISGNIIFNFKDVYKTACDKKCAVIVNTPEELISEVISFYDNELKYKTFCNNAKSIFDENKGAVNYVLERI